MRMKKLLAPPPRPGPRLLLILPCNKCVGMGDYSLCPNWRIILSSIYNYVEYGLLDLAAIDSCKPGIVLWGEEREYMWCDLQPSYLLYYSREKWRLDILKTSVLRDVGKLAPYYKRILYYVNVKAYREALDYAAEHYNDFLYWVGPSRLSPLSYRSRRERERLVNAIEEFLY